MTSRRLALSAAALSLALLASAAAAVPATAAETANGKGNLKVKLKLTSSGDIKVSWKAPMAKALVKKNVAKWVVLTSTSRTMTTDLKKYRVKKTQTSVVVPPAEMVTPESGDHTFVKVKLYRKGVAKPGESPTKWIKAPVMDADTTIQDRVTIGSFNVRSWGLESDAKAFDAWAQRKPHVIRNISSSGAGVIALQEAGGKDVNGEYGEDPYWVALVRELGSPWKLVDDLEYRADYSKTNNVYGKQGTRILYDSAKYSVLDHGAIEVAGIQSRKSTMWVPWAHFVDQASGKKFWMVDVHFQTGKTASSYKVRERQAATVVPFATKLAESGDKVFVAGDFNSTSFTLPDNGVHKAFLKAGFFDAYSTSNVSGEEFPTTNDFEFPVEKSPHRRDYIMSIGGETTGSHWYKNLVYNEVSQAASDHFMQAAQLPL
jgi:endonuclease/exonuclease/phosphatase family metal-dependent hydrolase